VSVSPYTATGNLQQVNSSNPGIFLLHFQLDENGDSDTWFSAAAPRSANPRDLSHRPQRQPSKSVGREVVTLGGISTGRSNRRQKICRQTGLVLLEGCLVEVSTSPV
jgi:hypothetical protein